MTEQMNESEAVLAVKDLRVSRGGVTVLDVPSATIARGETLALIGPNGAGKTTLLQALSYLLKPVSGELYFRGARVGSDVSVLAFRRHLAMVFQEPLLFDTTVFKNVAAGLKIRGMKGSEIGAIVMEQLERFGISHLAGRSARTLSGGEAQRASLARAFATQPEILFLDEPFASVDQPSSEALIEDLQSVLSKTETTAILATHDRMEALRLSDRIAVMKDGRIVQIGSPDAVMNHPVDEFVASFVGVETILSGKVVSRDGSSFTASVSGHEIVAVGDVMPEESVLLCIRPENVSLSTNIRREATSARNVFRAKIEKITPLGLYQRVTLDCGFSLVSYITSQSVEELSLREGVEVNASFKATAIHVLRRRR
jgi:tungstate transport system ATP-binding protein